MTSYDVFNGDADGILSLLQMRLSDPRPGAQLVTGRKRDIKLLDRIDAKAGDFVTVLDISMKSNAEDLQRILEVGANVFYVDHHNSGAIPDYPNLNAIIDLSPETCTAMLIDTCLEGAHRAWAVTAAFGDNFPKLAQSKARGQDLPLDALNRLGMLINYNGYGESIDDLLFHPKDLYLSLLPYITPMQFLDGGRKIYQALEQGYETDLANAKAAKILDTSHVGRIILLPDAAGSRRISGVFGNDLAQKNPAKAHAILTENTRDKSYLVSLRAPLSKREGADRLALQFDTGGGRAAAAGINRLPYDALDTFIQAFRKAF